VGKRLGAGRLGKKGLSVEPGGLKPGYNILILFPKRHVYFILFLS
jgi:hypothetical protein